VEGGQDRRAPDEGRVAVAEDGVRLVAGQAGEGALQRATRRVDLRREVRAFLQARPKLRLVGAGDLAEGGLRGLGQRVDVGGDALEGSRSLIEAGVECGVA